MKRILVLFSLLCTVFGAMGQTEHIVSPATADPLSGAPANNHFAYINNQIAAKGKLFLFFPGTGGVPVFYRQIVKHAANLGYHAVGLTYPNEIAINDLCLNSSDITCHRRARMEVFDGVDRHPDIQVDENNCIKRRAEKLIKYLADTYPSEGWEQYLDGTEVLWNKVVVSGHSQGGGHAGIISKMFEVSRVIMFAATDWVASEATTADWITATGPTPVDRYYGFINRYDEMVNFAVQQITWQNYGMDDFGSTVLVDGLAAPYDGTHMLYTELTPSNDPTKFHGSVVSDPYIPMDDNVPVFAPVWTYMLENYELSGSEQFVNNSIVAWPNPFISAFVLDNLPEHTSVKCFDVLGRLVPIYITGNKVALTGNAVSGVYTLVLENDARVESIKVVKQ